MKILPLLSLLIAPAAHADHPSVHGMLLFGNEKVYISHLAMFHSPHDYQLIAELELPAPALEAYKKSQAANPQETVFTLVPESFVLPELVANPKPFQASLVKGHFERGGTEFAANITVKLGKIVHFRKFDPRASHPKAATYLHFGNAHEAFVAHFISAKPDFDHVVQVGGSGGPAVILESSQSNAKPLALGSYSFTQKDNGAKLTLELQKSLYFETGDLAH